MDKQKPSRKGPSLVAVFAAISVVVGALAAVFFPVGPARRPSAEARPAAELAAASPTLAADARRCASAAAPRTCLLELLRARADADGPEAAFADLKALYDTDQTAHGFCHQLAHEIGHAGYKKFGDVAAAFAHGDNFCWSGYHHGVLESYVQDIGIDQLPQRLGHVCDEVPGRDQYTFGFYNCVHGLGHGLMAVTEDKVVDALHYCDLLDRAWDKDSCYGGVFMQNVINEDLKIHTPDFRENDPYYPCDVVGEQYKDSCYRMQTSHMLKVMGRDFAKVFAACAKTPDEREIDVCYASLGRDASGSTVSDVAKTKAICAMGKDDRQRRGCIEGAVKDFISFHHSDAQAKALCVTFEEPLESFCLNVAKDYYASFEK